MKTTVIQKACSTCTSDTWWWIKADGCDVVKGLWESTKGEWSGDVDLNDDHLQVLFHKFQEQLSWTKAIGLRERSNHEDIWCDFNTLMINTVYDLDFIHAGIIIVLIHAYTCCLC